MPNQLSGIFDDDKKTKSIIKKTSVPQEFWCNHYFHAGTKDPIPDGMDCCFIHYTGLPTLDYGRNNQSDVVRHPLYDYQEDVIAKLKTDIKLYVIKSPKLGMTELFLRWIIHQCFVNKSWTNAQVAIVVGTGIRNAGRMVGRMKTVMNNKFNPIAYGTQYDSKDAIDVNTVDIAAYPANHVDTVRDKPKVKFILVDECAFFTQMENNSLAGVISHYTGNANPQTILLSTAGESPKGLMYEVGEAEKSNYTRFYLTNPEKYGLKKHKESGTCIYDRPSLATIQVDDPTYERNFLGKWGAGTGNIFDAESLKSITERYDMPDPAENESLLAVDPAYSRSKNGSKFALLGLTKKNGIIYVTFEQQLDDPSNIDGVRAVKATMSKGYKRLVIDSSGVGLISDLAPLYETKAMNFNESRKINDSLKVILDPEEPIHKENVKMLTITEKCVNERVVKIHPKYKHLLDQLRAVRRKDDGTPDKKKVSFDLGDCFRMGCYELYSIDNYIVVV